MKMFASSEFGSFLMAGFECASHRPRHGRRLDLTAATRHDHFILKDYQRARQSGFRTVRDGIRWHLVEEAPGRYDLRTVVPMIRAARIAQVQIIWDLCHFGWPDDLDIFSASFVDRFAGLARAFTQVVCNETDEICYITPINEPSYLAWAAGESAYMYPYASHRGAELKSQLLRAYIMGIEAIWSVQPTARIVVTDPLIRVSADPGCPERGPKAGALQEAQYEFRDRLADAGAGKRYLDIIGACYYKCNQWYDRGEVLRNVPLKTSDPNRCSLARMLGDLQRRYGRPLFVAETSAELDERAGWASSVCQEVAAAQAAGVPVDGICWYPAIDHLGWDDNRPCRHGLWGPADAVGRRTPYWPLIRVLSNSFRKSGRLTQKNDYGVSVRPVATPQARQQGI